MTLKTKADLHLARKIWHFLGVVAVIYLYHNSSRSEGLQLAFIVTLLALAVDSLRHSLPTVNKVVCKILAPIMREREKDKMAGLTWLMVGVLIIMYIFSDDVVTLSLLFLAIGDPIASFVGLKYGRDQIVGKKTLQGSVAAFFVCFVISAFYFYFQNLMTDRLLIVSVLAGLIGAVTELVPIFRLDDNLTYPVLSSGLLWVLFEVFGGA
jgi:diacylglycerol kinase (CTP)